VLVVIFFKYLIQICEVALAKKKRGTLFDLRIKLAPVEHSEAGTTHTLRRGLLDDLHHTLRDRSFAYSLFIK